MPPLQNKENVQPEFFECGNVVASDRGIIETEGKRQMQVVPREIILNISLKYGCAAHRPVLELIIGGALAVPGLYALIAMLASGKASRYHLGMFVFGIIGAYMIWFVVRKHHYLLITGTSRKHKIRFARKTELSKIKSFCQDIKQRWHYEVTFDDL